MDDPLRRAEIEVVAVDRDIEVTGLDADDTITLTAGHGMKLPAHAPTRPTPTIVTLPPLKPGGIRALLLPGVDLEPINETELASLEEDAPIFYSVTFASTDAEPVDLRHFRAIAAQAADLDRRLVIAAFDT
jgi:hypothetical protein